MNVSTRETCLRETYVIFLTGLREQRPPAAVSHLDGGMLPNGSLAPAAAHTSALATRRRARPALATLSMFMRGLVCLTATLTNARSLFHGEQL